MDRTPNLKEKFPEGYQKLTELFGSIEVQSKNDRINEIYAVCEAAWEANLDRLRNTEVKYLLIGEAPPWSKNSPINYFYTTLKGPWCNRIWKAFFNEARPDGVNKALRLLAEKQFLLIDSLPFSMKYTTKHRKNPFYFEFIKSCKAFINKKLNNGKIQWAKEVKVALAFYKNGEALINAFPQGLELPTGQTIKLCPFLIAADGSNYTNSSILKDIWSIYNDRI
jgi:hypothetical protein